MQGILKFPIVDEMVYKNIKCLVPGAKVHADCAINALYFVKQIKDHQVAVFMAEQFNNADEGMDDQYMLQLLHDAQNMDEIKCTDFMELYDIEKYALKDWMDQLKTMLKNGNCTIFSYWWHEETNDTDSFSHTIIVAVFDDKLFAIDPQNELFMYLDEYLDDLDDPIVGFQLIFRKPTKKRIQSPLCAPVSNKRRKLA
jgi:hypothetical protein